MHLDRWVTLFTCTLGHSWMQENLPCKDGECWLVSCGLPSLRISAGPNTTFASKPGHLARNSSSIVPVVARLVDFCHTVVLM